MRLFILGATGLVGRAVVAEAERRRHSVVSAARRGDVLVLDATDKESLCRALAVHRPEVVLNCISYGSIEACAGNPGEAYRVNAAVNGHLVEACRDVGASLVAIGTDHYFTGDGSAKHDENAGIRLINDYAMTKYAGEQLVLAHPRGLVVRTNVTGFRGSAGNPTFIEWTLASLREGKPVPLFDDYHCSTIDAGSLAAATLDLAERGARGVFNVACRDVVSKRQFALAFAKRLSLPSDNLGTGSVRSLAVRRAESTGLDVTKAESVLGRPLASFDQVIDTLARLAKDV